MGAVVCKISVTLGKFNNWLGPFFIGKKEGQTDAQRKIHFIIPKGKKTTLTFRYAYDVSEIRQKSTEDRSSEIV